MPRLLLLLGVRWVAHLGFLVVFVFVGCPPHLKLFLLFGYFVLVWRVMCFVTFVVALWEFM